MITHLPTDLVKEIRRLHSTNETAARFFEWAAGRQRDARETTVDHLTYLLRIGRREALELAKSLDKLGCGEFLVGRRGAKSRIKWQFSLRSMGDVAKGGADQLTKVAVEDQEDLESMEPHEVGGENGDIQHSYQLRSDRRLMLSLPRDLTKKEAERLATFIQSLPFQD